MMLHPAHLQLKVVAIAKNGIAYIQFGNDPTCWGYSSAGQYVGAMYIHPSMIDHQYINEEFVSVTKPDNIPEPPAEFAPDELDNIPEPPAFALTPFVLQSPIASPTPIVSPPTPITPPTPIVPTSSIVSPPAPIVSLPTPIVSPTASTPLPTLTPLPTPIVPPTSTLPLLTLTQLPLPAPTPLRAKPVTKSQVSASAPPKKTAAKRSPPSPVKKSPPLPSQVKKSPPLPLPIAPEPAKKSPPSPTPKKVRPAKPPRKTKLTFEEEIAAITRRDPQITQEEIDTSPPGSSATPPGSAATPPGSAATPPGSAATPLVNSPTENLTRTLGELYGKRGHALFASIANMYFVMNTQQSEEMSNARDADDIITNNNLSITQKALMSLHKYEGHHLIEGRPYLALNLHSMVPLPTIINDDHYVPRDDEQLAMRAEVHENAFSWYDMLSHVDTGGINCEFFGIMQSEPYDYVDAVIHDTCSTNMRQFIKIITDPTLHNLYDAEAHQMPAVATFYVQHDEIAHMLHHQILRIISKLYYEPMYNAAGELQPPTYRQYISRVSHYTTECGPTHQRVIIIRCNTSYRCIFIWGDAPSRRLSLKARIRRYEVRNAAIVKNMRMHLAQYTNIAARMRGIPLPGGDEYYREYMSRRRTDLPAQLGLELDLYEFINNFQVPSAYLAERLLVRQNNIALHHEIAVAEIPDYAKTCLQLFIRTCHGEYEENNLVLLGDPASHQTHYDALYEQHIKKLAILRATVGQIKIVSKTKQGGHEYINQCLATCGRSLVNTP